ncbi:Fibrous sheath CABYR-binding protein [Quillaja saponaria]|uniref:Fibrous sheath CABYR-binding protein n=1 Tax=Quillaja saponaria TaxID=32244 RepID=A0AAD7VJP6_QUISA|nr:Fibrous sheath CABYR-binding protein [Quillaja saponaria]
MDQRNLQFQSLGICHKLYNFIMKSLASYACKTVTLGRPMHFGLTQAPVSDDATKVSGCRTNQLLQPETGDQPPHEGIRELPPVQINGGISSAAKLVTENMTEEEKMVQASARQVKAPKKMVSINDKVEEIYTSKKRKKKSIEKSTSLEHEEEEEEPKPLRSILKMGSNLNEK